MIEVNLLPGAKRAKKSKSGGGSINFAAIGPWISAKVKDKWLAGAIVTGIVAVAAIGYLFSAQLARSRSLDARLEVVLRDSTRFAQYIQQRARAQARRDSASLQLNIIRAIDEERYVWPHIMQEVSEALPQYTWLTSMGITGPQQGVVSAATMRTPPLDTSKVTKIRKDPVIPKDTIRMTLVGRTPDVQAYTRMMTNLEDSPFLEAVTLQGAIPQQDASGKEVNEFTLTLLFTRPDPRLLRMVPLLPPR
jgi:Tfp pilus assembly protein PilN